MGETRLRKKLTVCDIAINGKFFGFENVNKYNKTRHRPEMCREDFHAKEEFIFLFFVIVVLFVLFTLISSEEKRKPACLFPVLLFLSKSGNNILFGGRL